jgi:hypothetical protein
MKRGVVRVPLAIWISLAVLALVGVFIAARDASSLPTLNDPVRVEVIGGGSALNVAVNPCLGFDVTEVQVVTSVVKSRIASDAETTVWEYRPQAPGQTLFQTTQAGPGVVVPFSSLSTYPASNVFGVYVDYKPQTAPKGFTDRTGLTRSFTVIQSASDIKSYQKLTTTSCKA